MDLLEDYAKKIDLIISAGHNLLDVMKKEQRVDERNLIVYTFVRKIIRILASLVNLVKTGFEEEAQILARALIETRINCDYFLLMAKEDYKNATGRVIATLMLDKLKALRATNFKIGDQQIERKWWEKTEKEIKDSCGVALANKIKKYGFSGLPLEARALETGNKELYDLAYRLYSRNVHATDINEHLGDVLTPERFPKYEETLLPAVLGASCICGKAVTEAVNAWLRDRLGIEKARREKSKDVCD